MDVQECSQENVKLCPTRVDRQTYLTQSVFKVVLQKSIPTQIRQLILCMSSSKD